jgi:hypothetical protein
VKKYLLQHLQQKNQEYLQQKNQEYLQQKNQEYLQQKNQNKPLMVAKKAAVTAEKKAAVTAEKKAAVTAEKKAAVTAEDNSLFLFIQKLDYSVITSLIEVNPLSTRRLRLLKRKMALSVPVSRDSGPIPLQLVKSTPRHKGHLTNSSSYCVRP